MTQQIQPYLVPVTDKISDRHYPVCKGVALMDVLVAMLLFSITLVGLMRYQQVLAWQFYYLTESQQAWRIASQQLDSYPNNLTELYPQWSIQLREITAGSACKIVTVDIRSPKGATAEMRRWWCQTK